MKYMEMGDEVILLSCSPFDNEELSNMKKKSKRAQTRKYGFIANLFT